MKRILMVIAVVGLVWTTSASVVQAATEERIVVKQDGPVTQEYGPIPGNFPLAPDINWWPNECASDGPATAVCDTVPVTIPVPDAADTDDWYVEIKLEWDDDSDLDMYLWDNRQIDEQAGEEEPTYTEVSRSATGTPGELIRAFEPDLGEYNLTIVNWAGANLGYRLTAQMKIFAFTPPFESLAPEFFQGDDADDDEFVPFDFSAEQPAAPAARVESQPVPPTFGEVAIAPDRDFTNFGSSSFDEELAAPPAAPAFSPRLTAGSPPDVHPAVVLFWLLAVPLAAAGAAGFFVVRRSRSIGLAWR